MTILVDLNSVGFAATAANPSLKSGTFHTGAIFGALTTLRQARVRYPGRLICLDDGRSWRFSQFPAYKGNRDKNPDLVKLKAKWKEQKAQLVRFLPTLGVSHMIAGNMEADDLAARIVKKSTGPVTLVSGDKDWLQLVDERVMWVDTVRDRIGTPASFEALTGFKTQWQFIQAKALMGDAGDNIPGVGGIGPVAAKWIFDNYVGVDEFLRPRLVPEEAYRKFPKKLQDFFDLLEKQKAYYRNLMLVDLNSEYAPATQDLHHTPGKQDLDKFTALCDEFGFRTITSDLDRFVRPFLRR